MSGAVRIELNSSGIRELLVDDDVLDMLEDKARDVADAAQARGISVGSTSGGSGETPLPVDVEASVSGSRARAVVIIAHPAGIAVEAKHRVLVGSLDAAR